MARVAVIDYGLGNLFSIKNACEYVGLDCMITASKAEIMDAAAVILPGIGAYGDAMDALSRLDLVSPLRDLAQSDKPLIGICLGMQLLMSESFEFGHHAGLDIIPGSVVRFETPRTVQNHSNPSMVLKVPQVGWNRLRKFTRRDNMSNVLTEDSWCKTPLDGLEEGVFMYYVHSFYVKPQDTAVILSISTYGHIDFCSSLRRGNIFACQFHPERSGPQGLHIYRNISEWVKSKVNGMAQSS